MQIFNKISQLMLMLILLTAFSATQALSQTVSTQPTSDSVKISQTTTDAQDDCARKLEKTLNAYEKLQAAKSEVDKELVENKGLRAKEEVYNEELLKAVALLTSSEKRDKTFFEKLRAQLGRVLMNATDKSTIASIVGLILIIDKLKK